MTGAGGFIGAHTVRTLLDESWRVTALDCRELPGWMADQVEQVYDGADNPEVLSDLRRGRYAAVVHQGAISSTLADDWKRLEEVNIRQPLALAEAAFRGGARFVYASSHSVYGTIHRRIAVAEHQADDATVCTGPLNLYARSKLALDRAMADRFDDGQPWTALRYTNVFGTGETHKGPMASIISQLLRSAADRRRLTLFADTLKACRDYIPVENVSRVIAELVSQNSEPGVYNLGSASPISFATVLEWCAAFVGRPLDVRLIRNPLPDRYQYWTCADQSRLEQTVPLGGPIPIEEIKSAAAALFEHFASAPPGVAESAVR
ncbi:NAD-dependent epimerase/dehydratase family protein [Streptomyces violaceoruber]|uniref:NAD-dependent epimerase/dehydratase family protein n=1 Tax=Streptomyces violaceoruber TaxID=1935 RepID=UPI0027E544B7|nr:NAD-dependent epimerase/dehydratase family protein [Streptomyces violaceoruber]